ncbi:MAG: hypothetical protein ACEPO8_10635 [Rhodothermaceae bacterium]
MKKVKFVAILLVSALLTFVVARKVCNPSLYKTCRTNAQLFAGDAYDSVEQSCFDNFLDAC